MQTLVDLLKQVTAQENANEPVAAETNKSEQLCCNYANDYYGDQLCAPCDKH